MPIGPTAPAVAVNKNGFPINSGDAVTISGTVASVSGTGPACTVTVTLAGSGNSVSVQGKDMTNTASL
jgi:hypothetical protein